MKVSFAKKILSLLFLSLSVFYLASCQGVVYDNIRKEVELEAATIGGDIRSIVRFKNNLYFANGGIYVKNKDWNVYGTWIPCPSPVGQVLKLAADKDYLYALVGVTKEDEKEGTNVGLTRVLYYSKDGLVWTIVKGLMGTGAVPYSKSYIINTNLFCTNTINPENRSAYFILNDGTKGITNKAYLLSGDTLKELALGLKNADTKPCSNALMVSRSCIYYKGNVYFFTSNGSVTNETPTSPATMYYYGFGAYLHWAGENVSGTGLLCKDTIQSLGVTSDFILIGTNSGIMRKILVSKIPGATIPFTNNAESTLSAAYQVLSILVANPELPELRSTIYASQVYSGNGSSNSAQFDHIGLWAYYPIRGNWNRE